MGVKWHTVKVGDLLWDVHREKMGNTTMSRTGSWPVKIIEINHETGRAVASWNGNSPRPMYRSSVEKLRRSPHKPKERKP